MGPTLNRRQTELPNMFEISKEQNKVLFSKIKIPQK